MVVFPVSHVSFSGEKNTVSRRSTPCHKDLRKKRFWSFQFSDVGKLVAEDSTSDQI